MINKMSLKCRLPVAPPQKNFGHEEFFLCVVATKTNIERIITSEGERNQIGRQLIELLLKRLKSLFHFKWAFTSLLRRPFMKKKKSSSWRWKKNCLSLAIFVASCKCVGHIRRWCHKLFHLWWNCYKNFTFSRENVCVPRTLSDVLMGSSLLIYHPWRPNPPPPIGSKN